MKFPLPYAFARESQLLLEDDGKLLTLVLHPQSARGAVGEVLRKYPVQTITSMAPDGLVQRISAAYSQGESSAALVATALWMGTLHHTMKGTLTKPPPAPTSPERKPITPPAASCPAVPGNWREGAGLRLRSIW